MDRTETAVAIDQDTVHTGGATPDQVELGDIADVGTSRTTVVGYRELPPKPPGVILGSVEELVRVLSEKKLV